MTNDDRIPFHVLERALDRTDGAIAKELSNLENAVAALVTQLNTPPRIEDVDRLSKELKHMVEEDIANRLKINNDDISILISEFNKLSENIKSFISKIKWIAGIILVITTIAVSVISYVTTLTEKTINANTSIQIKQIEEKYKVDSKQREEEFKKIIEQIKLIRIK